MLADNEDDEGRHNEMTKRIQGLRVAPKNRAKLPAVALRESHVQPRRRHIVMPALAVLIGVAILLYPIVSTMWNNVMQREAASEYAGMVADTDEEVLKQQLAAAHEYNATRAIGPVLDPWTARLSDDNEPYKAYLGQLNLSDVMARMMIPAIDVDLPVYHGTRPDTLERGVGHLFGTDLPVGGEGTHAVMTAHSGLQTATLFDNLTDLKVGDSIYVEVYGETLRYEVFGSQVVLPDETESLDIQPGRDLITLITCTPYGVNSHRLLVHAERAPLDAAAEEELESVGWAIQWWMWAFAAGAILAVGLTAWYVYRASRPGVVMTNDDGAPVAGDANSGSGRGTGEGVPGEHAPGESAPGEGVPGELGSDEREISDEVGDE